jgi:LemA protein
MNRFTIGCGGVVLIAVLLGVALATSYNRLVTLDQSVNEKWAQVQNQFQRRADLIPNLVKTVEGAANFEKSTLTDIVNARASVGQVKLDPNKAPSDPAEFAKYQELQGQLGTALSRLLVVVEKYPELRANENFQTLQAQIEGTENRIGVARNDFNSVVKDYNTAVRRFPMTLFAGMLGFPPKPFFNAQPGAEKPPPVNFDFGNASPAPAASAALPTATAAATP